MRTSPWILLAALTASAASAACASDVDIGGAGAGGSDSSGRGGGGGAPPGTTGTTGTTAAETATATGTTGTSTAGTSTGASTASGTGGGCDELVAQNDCGQCASDACCGELKACFEDPACVACLEGNGPCDIPHFKAMEKCVATKCMDPCGYVDPIPLACDAPPTSPSAGSCVTIAPAPKPSTCAVDYDISFVSPGCEECVESQCCAEVDACAADEVCTKCLVGPEAWTCSKNSTFVQPLQDCFTSDDRCKAACSDVALRCNPVTNAGCVDQQKCLPLSDGSTACYDVSGDAGICEACSPTKSACDGGSACTSDKEGQCVKMCCDDGDCGTGVCEVLVGYAFGFCLAK